MLKFIFFCNNFFEAVPLPGSERWSFSTSKALTSGSAGDPAACGTVLASGFVYVVSTTLRRERIRMSHRVGKMSFIHSPFRSN